MNAECCIIFGHNESRHVLFVAVCKVTEHRNARVAHRDWKVWRCNAVVSSVSPHTSLKYEHTPTDLQFCIDRFAALFILACSVMS